MIINRYSKNITKLGQRKNSITKKCLMTEFICLFENKLNTIINTINKFNTTCKLFKFNE